MFIQIRRYQQMGLILGLLLTAVFLGACSQSTEAVDATAPIRTAAVTAPLADTTQPDTASAAAEPALVESNIETAVMQSVGMGGSMGNGNGNGGGSNGNTGGVGGGNLVPPVDDITDVDAAALLFMREEEKMAHDVYMALYTAWGLPVFQNIAASEQVHMDSVLYLLTAYGLNDPAAGNAVGVFTDANLQALYNDLMAQGTQTLADALRVGAAIEEIDILDLDARLAQTENASIIQVFQSLRSGSENHLASFVTNLERQTGEVYQPQYLPQDVYDAIVAAQSGYNGNGNGGSGTGTSTGAGQGGNGYRGGRNGNQGGGNGRSMP